MTQQPLLRREESLGYQVNHLSRLLTNALRSRVQAFGVVPGQFAQLLALYERDGRTQAELCRDVQIEQATMANTLNRMERDGLVVRTADHRDRRRTLVHLTPKARYLEAVLVASALGVNTAATAGLSEAEVAAFLSTVQRLIDNLERAEVDGHVPDPDEPVAR
ncbi:MarR family winged helix-turn-helix transcriptional regulator [Modestobacter roseus]|uniref:DNA-binding MarR family transcriptional regulator n=1 Tax=Modestobacter roseus TaxID=1181884 RepID=A0A562IRZ2_9ACTN|nr:MarR family transcriptional regulator [Modestobacter roseus]MQA35099.1 winged helix DNA-binding protein [Modestobacter roseus]TWH73672.1 DNA-binding MarR family transcriptional regulator [Modestobacter roseus]